MIRAAVHWSDAATKTVHIYADAIEASIVDLLGANQRISKDTLVILVKLLGIDCKKWLQIGDGIRIIRDAVIYDDDTRAILRAKLFTHIKHTISGPHHIYTWANMKPNIEECVDQCFTKGTPYVSTATLTTIIDTTFNDSDHTNIPQNALDPEETKMFLNARYANVAIPVALEVERIDADGRHIPMHAMPFQPKLVLEGTVTTTGDYQPEPNRGRQLRMSNSQRLVGDMQVVHFTTSADLEKVTKLIESNQMRRFVGFIKRYCPLLHNVTELDAVASTKVIATLKNALQSADSVVKTLRTQQPKQVTVDNTTFRRVNLIVAATPDAKQTTQAIDVGLLFSSIHPEPLRPFYELRDYDNQLFKMYQYSLGKNVSFDNLRDWTHTTKYTKLSDMSSKPTRSKRSLCAWLTIEGSAQQFCRIVIFEDGSYQLSLKNNTAARAFSTVRAFIDHISNILALPSGTFYQLHEEDFKIAPPFFAEYVEHDADYLVSMQKPEIETIGHIKDWLTKYMYPYAYVIFVDRNVVLFKYKRVDDYIDAKDVYEMASTLKQEGVPQDAIIEQICNMFNITEDIAIARASAPPVKKNGVNAFKSRYNNGVLVKITVNTKYQARVECKGIRNPEFFNRVQQFVHAACLAKKDGLVKFDVKINEALEGLTNVKDNLEDVKEDAEIPLKKEERKKKGDEEEEKEEEEKEEEKEEEEEEEDIMDLVEFGGGAKATVDEKEIQRYRDQIKKSLYDIDRNLFAYTKPKANYSLKCQTSDMRMPIGLTSAEKAIIDKKYPHSYTTSVIAGSSEEMCKQNHYICPRIWCPISRVAVTEDDLVNGFCPPLTPGTVADEKPIVLESSYWNTKNKGADRYPGYLGKHIHPQGFSLPCCFKTKSKDLRPICKPITERAGTLNDAAEAEDEVDEAEVQDVIEGEEIAEKNVAVEEEAASSRYIHKKSNVPMEPRQYGVPPRALASYLDSLNCATNAKEGSKCFVRRGVQQGPNSFIACMSYLLNVASPDTLVQHIATHMSPADYITLNGGNTLKLFIDPNIQITNVEHYKKFQDWICQEPTPDPIKRYITAYGLKNVVETIQSKPHLVAATVISVRREFIIYNSFQNFLAFLSTPTMPKHHDFLYDLMSPRFKWLNPHHRQLIVFERDAANEIFVHCPKYVGMNQAIDLTQTFIMVLKQETIYEPIVRVLFERTGLREMSAFSYTGSGAAPIKKLVDNVRNGCRSTYDEAITEAREIRAILESLGYVIKKYVLTAGFKLCGYIVQNNVYVPLKIQCPFTLAVRPGIRICYASSLNSLEPDVLNALQLFKNLNARKTKRNRSSIYGNPENILEEGILVGLKIDGHIVPINMSKAPLLKASISELTLDDIIFVQGVNINIKTRASRYETLLSSVVRTVLTTKELSRQMHVIKHPLNPLSMGAKLKAISHVVQDALAIVGNATIEEKALLEEDIYQKELRFILRQHQDDTIQIGELFMNQYDIIRDPRLEQLEERMKNPFQYVYNSIEDYVEVERAIVIDNVVTDTVGVNIEAPEWRMWALSKVAIADSVTITPVRTRATLCGKTRPWVMHAKLLSTTDICDLIMIASDLKGVTLDHDTIEEYLYNTIINDHENNTEALIKELSINDSFAKENKLHSLELSVDEILDIRNKQSYSYGLYELRNLMVYVGINLVIAGRKQERLLNGYLYFNNVSHSTMIFLMTPKGELHLVFDPVQKKFLFNESDVSELPKPGPVIRIIPQNHI
jgi:hypothetical protein